jgi:class 3 adenylate cyclase
MKSASKRKKMTQERSQREVLKGFLRTEASHAEIRISQLRLILCAIFIVRALFLTQERHYSRLWNADPATLMDLGFMTFGLVFSLGLLWAYKYSDLYERWTPSYSVLLDSIVLYGAISTWIIWPSSPHYQGFIYLVQIPLLFLLLFAAALRMSQEALRTSVVCTMLGHALFFYLDWHLNAHLTKYTSNYVSEYFANLLAFYLLAYLVLTRTKDLVIKGGQNLHQSEMTRQRMKRLISGEIVDELLSSDKMLIHGKRQKVALLFSDLRGFTSYSEKHPPDEMMSELNEYLACMVEAIHQAGGSINKFIGDAIFAVFGAPNQKDTDAQYCIDAAWSMHCALKKLNKKRLSEGKVPFKHGIGLHYGEVIAGTVGALERMEYTVMGDAVNTASRLESHTKSAGLEILLSDEIVQEALKKNASSNQKLSFFGEIDIRGREQTIQAHTFSALLEPPLST